jgi:hypothetical protein
MLDDHEHNYWGGDEFDEQSNPYFMTLATYFRTIVEVNGTPMDNHLN